jgi:hypothetical protein
MARPSLPQPWLTLPTISYYALAVLSVAVAWARCGRFDSSVIEGSCELRLFRNVVRYGIWFPKIGREFKCIHPLRDHFGSIAVIGPILRQSSEVRVIELRLPAASTQREPSHRFTRASVRGCSER